MYVCRKQFGNEIKFNLRVLDILEKTRCSNEGTYAFDVTDTSSLCSVALFKKKILLESELRMKVCRTASLSLKQ